MPEKFVATLLAKIVEYWDAIMAALVGIAGGGLAYATEVKNGTRKWDLSAFLLSTASAGFFAVITYMICLDMFEWSPGLSVAAAGVIAHLGADKVRAMLTNFITKKFQ